MTDDAAYDPPMPAPPHILVVQAPYYQEIAAGLLAGVEQELRAAGASWEVVDVAGAFELPAAVRYAVRAMNFIQHTGRRWHGFITLGCVVRGETDHYDHICRETARGLMDISVQYALALGFGVLTVHGYDQAEARSRPDEHNKGVEAARACLGQIALKRRLGLYRE